MCIDYTNHNKDCPKDFYPLLSINQKVEAITKYEVLYFLDLYKGFHYVLMDPVDAPKIAFVIDCETYNKMSSDLKNVGLTYQDRVDQVFMEKIGMNMEV